MARSTGPVLAVGGISFGNQWIFNHNVDFRIVAGTAIAAAALAGLEHAAPELAVGIAYIALITIIFTRVDGKPSPAENLLQATGYGQKKVRP